MNISPIDSCFSYNRGITRILKAGRHRDVREGGPECGEASLSKEAEGLQYSTIQSGYITVYFA